MQQLVKIVFLLTFVNGFSQETLNFEAIDSLYREDQFYFSTTYNVLQNAPKAISQNSYSAGVNVGFLRDFPINKNRTFAIAPGLGLSYNNYKQNLIVSKENNQIAYELVPSGTSFKKNKFVLYAVDVPIEFRWRTSTFESHKFWRIYTGVKLSYVFLNQSRYVSATESFKVNNNPDVNKFAYGVYMAAGYNTWNFYAYYGIQNIFKNAYLNDEPLKINSLNLGIMFYIL